jgi:hypothetical protein
VSAATAAALAGLGGVVLTVAFGVVRDRTEWKRKNEVRWHDVRRAAYVAFLHAADAVWTEGSMAPYDWNNRLKSDPENAGEALAELTRFRGELAAYYREVQLVGSEEVVAAAREVTRAVNSIASAVGATVNAPTSPDVHEKADQASADAGAASENFKEAARAELGIAPHA